jgi:hypothetical protein
VIFKLFVKVTTMNWYQRHQFIAIENEFDSPRRITKSKVRREKKEEMTMKSDF